MRFSSQYFVAFSQCPEGLVITSLEPFTLYAVLPLEVVKKC